MRALKPPKLTVRFSISKIFPVIISKREQGIGEVGKWGSGEVGKWGSGEVGKWGSGEVGKWG
ncbi:MAG: hypothetical protein IM495_18805, partial [Microcystis sp. M099S2]|nr:hypothetical protein [Microcystis sp. M099S2]